MPPLMRMPKFVRRIAGHLVTNIWFSIDMQIYGVPVHISPPHIWWCLLLSPGERVGIFHKRVGDCYNPRRWGGHILGLEIGSRG